LTRVPRAYAVWRGPRSLRRNRADAARPFRLDAVLDLAPEVADQPLDRPGGSVAESADRVPFDLLGHVEQHVDLLDLGLAAHQPLHHAHHPARALPARRALAAALVLVELREAPDRLDDV